MALVLAKNKISLQDFKKAKKDYQTYIKLTIDLDQKTVALGGEYHADAEKKLLKQGSKQKSLWGGGVNLETKEIETNALINLRPPENNSLEILNPQKRKKFVQIAKTILKDYV